MRRKDREVTQLSEIISIMEKCDVCRLAINDGDFPYIVPMNFGMAVTGDKIAIYFHGALQGKKYDLIEKNNKVSFELDCGHNLVATVETGSCTMEYESVVGQGIITILSDGEKVSALDILMEHYHTDEDFEYNKKVVPATKVMRLDVLSVTGKRRKLQI